MRHIQLEKTFELAEKELPGNRKGSHQLDCLVINTAIALNQQKGLANFDTVRGAYLEGAPVYPEAMIFKLTHIQICVRNPECILGYFVPVL